MPELGPEFVAVLRDALSRFHDEAGKFVRSQGVDPAAGSRAAVERSSYVRPESLLSASAIATLLIECVAEHVTAFVKTITPPVEPIACWTCVRSMLESSAIATWLCDPTIDAKTRVGTSFAYRYEGLEQQEKFGRATNLPPAEQRKLETHIDEVERTALALGFAPVTNRNGRRIGIAEQMPATTDMIKIVLDEERAYRLLSAVAHGHIWAIQQLGFKPATVQPAQTVVSGVPTTALEKYADNVSGYAFLALRAMKSLALPLWNQCLYFGWEIHQLAVLLESVYDQVHVQPALRFWR
jgi:hypothetical protein